MISSKGLQPFHMHIAWHYNELIIACIVPRVLIIMVAIETELMRVFALLWNVWKRIMSWLMEVEVLYENAIGL